MSEKTHPWQNNPQQNQSKTTEHGKRLSPQYYETSKNFRISTIAETLENTRPDYRFLEIEEKKVVIAGFLKFTSHIPDEYLVGVCIEAVRLHDPNKIFLPTHICYVWRKTQGSNHCLDSQNAAYPDEPALLLNNPELLNQVDIETQKEVFGSLLFEQLTDQERELLINDKIDEIVSKANNNSTDKILFDRLSSEQLLNHAIEHVKRDLANDAFQDIDEVRKAG